MNHVFEMNGNLSDTDIIEIFSMILKSDQNSCSLNLTIKGYSKKIVIKKNKVINSTFINSKALMNWFLIYIITELFYKFSIICVINR